MPKEKSTVTFPLRLPNALHDYLRKEAFDEDISMHKLILKRIDTRGVIDNGGDESF